MSTVAQNSISADEFIRLPDPEDGSKQELVFGKIESKPANGFLHGCVQGNIGLQLGLFLQANPIGSATFGSGVRTHHNPDSVRGPDVAFWSAERMPLHEKPIGYHDVPADLCVEVISPHDRLASLRRKATEYLNSGVRMVWIVDPEDRTVTIYRQLGEGRVLSDDAMITGEDVLPEFSCRIAEFFK